MDMALNVLQMMAGNGNKYIRACHSLLTKIKSSIRTRNSPNPEDNDDQVQARDQEQSNNNGMSTESSIAAELPHDQGQAFNLDFEGDPGL